MAPPVFAKLSAITGNMKYLDVMDQMWDDTTTLLYDTEEHLYYRDTRFKVNPDGSGPREKNGEKIFWSRGNGWVMGGIVRVLEHMPADYPQRLKYVKLFKDMAARLASIQGSDGLWRSSLLDPDSYPNPETSGTAFFCYSLAWGINNGILDQDRYLPVVTKAWRGLVGSVHESGKLGWVQAIGHKPESVTSESTEVYAVGAFLLAGSEVIKLKPPIDGSIDLCVSSLILDPLKGYYLCPKCSDFDGDLFLLEVSKALAKLSSTKAREGAKK